MKQAANTAVPPAVDQRIQAFADPAALDVLLIRAVHATSLDDL